MHVFYGHVLTHGFAMERVGCKIKHICLKYFIQLTTIAQI